MNRFELATTELTLLAEMQELERKLQVLRADMAQDSTLGAPMKWIEVHFMRATGGILRIRETLPLYKEPWTEPVGFGRVTHYRPLPIEVTIHLNPSRAQRVYETFRGEGGQPLYTPANGVAAHAPWSQELEDLLRSC